MSGTGNSYRVSTWLGEIATKKGSQLKVVSVKNNEATKKIKNGKNNLLGIVFPAHGFTMPWHILKFVCRLPRGKSSHAFCVATRGSLKFGKVFIPGMSGSGTFIIALLLFLKGYNVHGVMSVNMPSNWFHCTLSSVKKVTRQLLPGPNETLQALLKGFFLSVTCGSL